MPWFKHVVVDVLATVCILLATVFAQPVAQWIVWIYTPIMVLMKLGALGTRLPRAMDAAPDWVFHLLYAVNLLLLLTHAWYWVAAGWAVIWILSVAVAARGRK